MWKLKQFTFRFSVTISRGRLFMRAYMKVSTTYDSASQSISLSRGGSPRCKQLINFVANWRRTSLARSVVKWGTTTVDVDAVVCPRTQLRVIAGEKTAR